MYCQNCGEEIKKNDVSCDNCNYELKNINEEKPVKTKRNFTLVTSLLLLLLGIRFIGMLISLQIIDMIPYLIIIIGVLLKAKWGSLLAIVYSLFAIIVTIIGPLIMPINQFATVDYEITDPIAFLTGLIIAHVLILLLSWKEYKSFKKN